MKLKVALALTRGICPGCGVGGMRHATLILPDPKGNGRLEYDAWLGPQDEVNLCGPNILERPYLSNVHMANAARSRGWAMCCIVDKCGMTTFDNGVDFRNYQNRS